MTGPRVAVVTPMQRAVIRELAHDGADNAEIADRLKINICTVRSHMKGAMKATGQPSRAALAVSLLRRRVVLRVVDNSGRHGDGHAA